MSRVTSLSFGLITSKAESILSYTNFLFPLRCWLTLRRSVTSLSQPSCLGTVEILETQHGFTDHLEIKPLCSNLAISLSKNSYSLRLNMLFLSSNGPGTWSKSNGTPADNQFKTVLLSVINLQLSKWLLKLPPIINLGTLAPTDSSVGLHVDLSIY